jgi:large subunit ribosomal protein L31
MKQGIHPTYYEDAVVICSCGNTWNTGSTKKDIHTDVCSACHPFFTGEQRIVDTAGQVERFMRRLRTKDQIRAQARIKAEARKLAEEAARKAKARGEDAKAAFEKAYEKALAELKHYPPHHLHSWAGAFSFLPFSLSLYQRRPSYFHISPMVGLSPPIPVEG